MSEAFVVERLADEDARTFGALTYPRFRSKLEAVAEAGSLVVAIGARADGPAGLALAELSPDGEPAELLSVATRSDLRRRGVAAALVAKLESELQAAGAPALLARYERGLHYTAGVEGLLWRRAFPKPAVHALIARCSTAGIREAPWIRTVHVPRAFEVFSWRELDTAERASILERQAREPWFPEPLSPFLEDDAVEHGNSLGLRLDGVVVGWHVNHRILADRVRYTTTWVRRDLQPSGVAIALVAESIRRHLDGPLADEAPWATFMVYADNDQMIRFVRQHLSPYLDSLNESCLTVKPLSAGRTP